MRAPPEIVQPNDRRTDPHGKIHDLADLLGMGLRERSTENGEVLAEHENESAVDHAMAGHDAVAQVTLAVETKIGGSMSHERVELHERLWVEQQLEALTRGELAAFVLLIDALFPSPKKTLGTHLLEPRELRFFRGHGSCPSTGCVKSRRRWLS